MQRIDFIALVVGEYEIRLYLVFSFGWKNFRGLSECRVGVCLFWQPRHDGQIG
jgi:hypothetical protein